MKFKDALFIMIPFGFIIGCINNYNKDKLVVKKLICENIWREKFRVFSGGAYSAELYSDYITDSVNFRVYIGTHDEHSNFLYRCIGDTIIVEKFERNNISEVKIDSSILLLSKLKKEKRFD